MKAKLFALLGGLLMFGCAESDLGDSGMGSEKSSYGDYLLPILFIAIGCAFFIRGQLRKRKR